MKGWMYILECSDGSYYTGSTNNLELRLAQHQNGEGANHTKKHSPVKLVYTEEFQRIDEAFYREKQVQGWSRKKKEALINGEFDKLTQLSRNYTQYPASTSFETMASTSSASENTLSVTTPVTELVEGKGEAKITTEHVKNNTDVRELLGKSGIKPELLPAEEDIKKLERRVKAGDKDIAKNKLNLTND